MQAYLPFGCSGCKRSRMMLRIATPAEVRLAMFLIQILNYMWIEAIFVNRNEMSEDCFAVCPDTTWLLRKVGAIVFAFFLSIPAMRIMYVPLTWMVGNRCAWAGPSRLNLYGEDAKPPPKLPHTHSHSHSQLS